MPSNARVTESRGNFASRARRLRRPCQASKSVLYAFSVRALDRSSCVSTSRLSIGWTIGAAFETRRPRSAGASRCLRMAPSSALPTVRERYGASAPSTTIHGASAVLVARSVSSQIRYCLLYTSDAADDLLCVDLGG